MKILVMTASALTFLVACGPTPGESCRSYGLTPGTDNYAQCIGAETRNNQNNRRDAMRDFNRANESRGGSVGNYCPIGLTC